MEGGDNSQGRGRRRREAAQHLRRNTAEILRRWEESARRDVPAARGRSRAILYNSLPRFLEGLANALAAADTQASAAVEAPREHAEERATLEGYSLDQVIEEYHLLRRVMLQVLEADAPLDREARLVLHQWIDRAVLESATRFAEKTQAALRESEERHRLLVQGVKDYAIFMVDPEGCVRSWNEGAERITGYQAEEVTGRHFSCFYVPEDREAGKPEQYLRSAAEQGRCEGECWMVRRDGSRFFAQCTLTAIHDPAGRLCGFAKITRDITARKLAEEERAEVEAVTGAALAHLGLDDLLKELLGRIRGMLSADTAALFLLEGDLLVARTAGGLEGALERGVRIPVGTGFAGRIASERRAIIVDDADPAEILNPLLREKGVRSLLGVPLMVEGRVIGVLHVGTLHPRRFSQPE